MKINYLNNKISCILFAIWINISAIYPQQWLGASNSLDPIYRTGKVGIGLSTQPLNALDVFGQMSLRDAGDWAVIYKPDNPNTSFLFRRGTNTPKGYLDLLQITNKGQVLMGMINTNPIYSMRGGTLVSNYSYTGVSSNPYFNQGSAIWGELTYGGSGTAPTGTVHGISSVVNVNSCGDENSEMAGLFVSLRADAPSRLWGVDLGVNGPVTEQANLLTGTVNAINNYNNSRPTSGSFGAVIISKPNAGAGNRGSAFPTFSIDAGLAIVGYSNTVASPLSVYDRALQIGGGASGWMTSVERSKFRTGIDIKDYIDNGLLIHEPQTGGNGFALIVAPNAGRVGIGTNNPSYPFEVVPGVGSSFNINMEGNRTVVRIMDDLQNPVLQIGRNSSYDYVNLEYDGTNLNVFNKNLTITSNLGVGMTTGTTSKVDINGTTGYSQLRLRTKFTPLSTSDLRGNVGDIAWDDNYFYLKTTNGWKRVPMSNF